MLENESLRDFIKHFKQVVLQMESYIMDALLLFKRSLSLGTIFFESFTKKLFAIIDDLFWRIDKYAMLEDDVQATSQQIIVTNQATKNSGKTESPKPPDNWSRQGRWRFF